MSTLLTSTNVATAANPAPVNPVATPTPTNNKTARRSTKKHGRPVTELKAGKGSKSAPLSSERFTMSDTSSAVLVAPIASQAQNNNEKVFATTADAYDTLAQMAERIADQFQIKNDDTPRVGGDLQDFLVPEFLDCHGFPDGSPLKADNASLSFARTLFPFVIPATEAGGSADSYAEDAFIIAHTALRAAVANRAQTKRGHGTMMLLTLACNIAERRLQADADDAKAEKKSKTGKPTANVSLPPLPVAASSLALKGIRDTPLEARYVMAESPSTGEDKAIEMIRLYRAAETNTDLKDELDAWENLQYYTNLYRDGEYALADAMHDHGDEKGAAVFAAVKTIAEVFPAFDTSLDDVVLPSLPVLTSEAKPKVESGKKKKGDGSCKENLSVPMRKTFPMPDILADNCEIGTGTESEIEFVVVEALQDFIKANKSPKARDKYDALGLLKDEIEKRQRGEKPINVDVKAQPLLHVAADAAFAWIERFRCFQPELTEDKPKRRAKAK